MPLINFKPILPAETLKPETRNLKPETRIPQPATIGSRTYTGYTLHFQGGTWPMLVDDLKAFNKYWNS